MTRTLLLAAVAVVLSACSSMGMSPGGMMGGPAPMGPMAAPTPPTAAYLDAAAQSDLYEVTSSQLAIMRTQNPDIRRYATRMIDHHTMTTNTLLTASRAAGVAPPPTVMGPEKRAMVQQLQAQTGMNFDRLYTRQQVTAHQQALAIHTRYAASGDTPQIRAAAAAAVPIVQRHLTEIQGVQARMGAL